METGRRSYEKISDADLSRLAALAVRDRTEFFARKPCWARLYEHRVLCVALCQGAALHFINGKNGIKDFDVWTFYAAHEERPFPYRRNKACDFGPSKFGRDPLGPDRFVGRCVDMLARSIDCKVGTDPVIALQTYLSEKRTESARKLAEKAVVILEPSALRGTIIWPRTIEP